MVKKFLKKNILYIAWVQALAAMLGSLYFSEIRQFPPCILCWYQRIFMYPLVFILPVGILKKDKNIHLYVLPLAIIGALVAVYHNLLYNGIILETITPCAAGVSCTTKFIEFFGFVTIPFLSLCSFLVVIASMVIYHKLNKK